MTPTPDNPVDLDALISFVENQHPDADVFTRLTDAVNLAESLGATADALIGHYIEVARSNGASWTEIGSCLGVSKQAAQQRHVTRSDEDPDFPTRRLFSRFTKRARNVMQDARREANERGDAELTNSHLVLGLLSEPEGIAARAMVALGAPLETVREETIAKLPKVALAKGALAKGRPGSKSKKRVSLAKDSRKTLELALREALRLQHNYIGTEHLLLGLLRGGGDAAKVLDGLGVTLDAANAWIEAALDDILKSMPSN